ncbi:DNA-3-methyladenine glycosylase [Faunimonas pinastri]|uniref:Putative 3-methyladenine DNA glycosylase n=1 Tax=Faunimonas pinastri TaxID=1855383 RepID=A0A1H9AWK7_9HYPH|nr:DNA-3-methyladenine glycosylase [Faunimonas pinastri]SEP81150.1 DNA-3-methyladenine glycosylase [Faunimonas pinastri]
MDQPLAPHCALDLSELRPLSRAELPADTVELSRFLIGRTLVHRTAQGTLAGRIVETEAYLPDDAASHAFRGPTKRNGSMFLRRGHAYVYISYGVWPCMNVSSDEAGTGAAVLLRALEIVSGAETMLAEKPAPLRDLARGPGRLARAMRITLGDDGLDLCATGDAVPPLFLAGAIRQIGEIGASVRIGITKEADRLLRFFERGNSAVSGPGRLNR